MPEETPETPPMEDEGDDADVAAFAEEWQQMRDKLATIPDDIGEKLDRLLSGQHSAGAPAQPSATPRTRTSAQSAGASAPSQAPGAPAGQSQQAQNASGLPATPDKQPKSKHWYYRDAPWKRNG